jgi:Protein of unknown function (DUF2868)
MTEDQARQVLLLQAFESAGDHPHWKAADRSWATQQAVALVGDRASPAAFVAARAGLALQRLLPRDPAAQRWLQRRAWHPAWLLLALLGGAALGLAADQLGPPQQVNLLAPAVWAVVAWNLVVYLALLVPGNAGTLRQWLASWGAGSAGGAGGAGGVPAAGALWAPAALPLALHRWAACLHAASAALALGLIAGLYLRGLVLDYRAGWQSTFLDVATVQSLWGALLAPASWLTGVAMPDLAPLQLRGGQTAQASAAPWIHLYAATLALAVVLPRGLLALGAWARARHLARRVALPLDTPYFESLHPLMKPRLPRAVRLLWVVAPDVTPSGADACAAPLLTLFDARLPTDCAAPTTALRSDEGDELVLRLAPPLHQPLVPSAPQPWWRAAWLARPRWLGQPDTAQQTLAALRAQTDAVLLLLGNAQSPTPAWLAQLGRPVVALHLGPAQPEATALSVNALAQGWLPQGRLFQALMQALPDDPRLLRLRNAWQAQQLLRLDACMAVLAQGLAQMATTRVVMANNGLLARRTDAQAARDALAQRLQMQWADTTTAQAAWAMARAGEAAAAGTPGAAQAAPAAPMAALRKRVGEGRTAVMGGVVTGALAGFKADLLSGGLTMGGGALAGGLVGALGGVGLARGLNVVRGTDSSHAAWDDDALGLITQSLLQQHLSLVHGCDEASALAALQPELARSQKDFAAAWRSRQRGLGVAAKAQTLPGNDQPSGGQGRAAPTDTPETAAPDPAQAQEPLRVESSATPTPSAEAQALATVLQPLLLGVVQRALGGPS